MTLPPCLQDCEEEATLPQLCLLFLFVLLFLNRSFRVVFNSQQSLCLVVFLCGFQMIRKKESKKESKLV